MASASVGTLGIELLDEDLKPGLLLETGHARRACGLLVQRQVHALVAAVLVRVAGLDALDGDAEPQPPHGQLRQVVEPVGAGEGKPVVGADRGG
jgi:hypothetical protein